MRISPFDASGRRHTSFAAVQVLPEVDDRIDIDIQEKDLRIDTFRASVPGGQHVNKTSSAVRLTHLPTNIVVPSQTERSQHRNKDLAMKVLRSRLYDLEKKKQEDEEGRTRESKKDISWGSQIRSYAIQPYQLVKDHRTRTRPGTSTPSRTATWTASSRPISCGGKKNKTSRPCQLEWQLTLSRYLSKGGPVCPPVII